LNPPPPPLPIINTKHSVQIQNLIGKMDIREDEVLRFQEDGAIHIKSAFGPFWLDKIRAGIQVPVCTSGLDFRYLSVRAGLQILIC
jgi:hypothetical protein